MAQPRAPGVASAASAARLLVIRHGRPWTDRRNAGNDAGGITTWSVIGSRYGYSDSGPC
jgi:hypothetical protein